MKLKPYGDPIAWREACLVDRLKALVQHYCTGPCGQSQQVGEIRSNTQSTLTEARTQLAAVTAGRDRLREAVIQARDHTVSYAKYLREFHWSNTADEFDELRAKLNEALAATEPKGE